MILPLWLFITVAPATDPSPGNYWHDHEQGWFWYRDAVPTAPRDVSDRAEPESSRMPAADATDPMRALQAWGAEVEDSLARAVLEPSAANLQRYMELNARTLAMAREFAIGWQRLLWRRPALDSRLAMPAADPAVQAVHDARDRYRRVRLRELAREQGLWFFFRGDCPVCHRFAPVLARFAWRHGFTVLAVSLDGGRLEEFPDARFDRNAAARLQVDAVPALYLAAPGRRAVTPVGYGYMSAGELGRRLIALAEEDRPPAAHRGRAPDGSPRPVSAAGRSSGP